MTEKNFPGKVLPGSFCCFSYFSSHDRGEILLSSFPSLYCASSPRSSYFLAPQYERTGRGRGGEKRWGVEMSVLREGFFSSCSSLPPSHGWGKRPTQTAFLHYTYDFCSRNPPWNFDRAVSRNRGGMRRPFTKMLLRAISSARANTNWCTCMLRLLSRLAIFGICQKTFDFPGNDLYNIWGDFV